MKLSDLQRRCAAEFVGTAGLLCSVAGSGIMGERLAMGNAAIALLVNSVATGAVLYALIVAFGPVSGAHFNPLVTIEAMIRRVLPATEGLRRVLAQVCGGLAGVAIANIMFELPPFAMSRHVRTGGAQWLAEIVAAFGLMTVIRLARSPAAVAAYIVAAYWFTASTSFANPAVTLARAFTDTFSGIRLADVPGFTIAQAVGAGLACLFTRWLQSEEKA